MSRWSSQPIALRPHDVGVGLQIALAPDPGFRELAAAVGLSLGEAHNSVKRLEIARLLMTHRRAVNATPLLEFLVHGVPYAFPAELGPETQGVPTAHSSPALREMISSYAVVVWPSAEGEARGSALAPLCKQAASMPRHNPPLYRWLTLVDALRVGRSRERDVARDLLEREVRAVTRPE
jgi:hypothetical protein